MGRRIEKRTPATYEDVLAAPEHLVAELIDGTLYLSPRPAPLHANTTGKLLTALRGFDGAGGWIILIEPELHMLPGNALVPDLAGWRRERLPALPAKAHIDVAPDWTCEVRSPPTGALDRKVKMPRYAAAGVPWLWLIDPEEQVLEVFRLEGDKYVAAGVYSEDDKVRAQPFEAAELDLAELWRW